MRGVFPFVSVRMKGCDAEYVNPVLSPSYDCFIVMNVLAHAVWCFECRRCLLDLKDKFSVSWLLLFG